MNGSHSTALVAAGRLLADITGSCPACRYDWGHPDGCGMVCKPDREADCWVTYAISEAAAQCDCAVCHWTEDSEGCYGTDCGKAWMFTHELGLDGEMRDGFRYCPFCGRMIDTQLGNLTQDRTGK